MKSLTMRKRMIPAIAAAIALSLFPTAPKAFSETISLGTVAPGPTYWPLYVGQELKMFENNGISPTFTAPAATRPSNWL
jgi:ABC-type nitrate/sulfonate/bicarbonate transport system substrate-binding protein